MTKAVTPEEKLKRANEAQALLTNETYREAWSSFEENQMALWRQTAPNQPEVRERIWHQVNALRAAKEMLERFVAEGRAAAAQIERTKRRGNRNPEPSV